LPGAEIVLEPARREWPLRSPRHARLIPGEEALADPDQVAGQRDRGKDDVYDVEGGSADEVTQIMKDVV